jgi:hypothetical protein
MGLYVGENVQPYDGKSDFSQITIPGYPAKMIIDNVSPNNTYFVSVQALAIAGGTYTLSATFVPQKAVLPVTLRVNDQPYADTTNERQFTDFYFTPTVGGNSTVSLYVYSGGSDRWYLSAGANYIGRIAKNQWYVDDNKRNTWVELQIPFTSTYDRYGVSVASHDALQFYIKVTQNNTSTD